jgi:hypothetical protein
MLDPAVLEASDGHSLQYALRELRADRDFMLEAVRINYQSVRYAAPELLSAFPDVAVAAVRQNGHILTLLPRELQANRSIVLEAVSRTGQALVWAGESVRVDREVVIAAARQDRDALRFSPLGRDPSVLAEL